MKRTHASGAAAKVANLKSASAESSNLADARSLVSRVCTSRLPRHRQSTVWAVRLPARVRRAGMHAGAPAPCFAAERRSIPVPACRSCGVALEGARNIYDGRSPQSLHAAGRCGRFPAASALSRSAQAEDRDQRQSRRRWESKESAALPVGTRQRGEVHRQVDSASEHYRQQTGLWEDGIDQSSTSKPLCRASLTHAQPFSGAARRAQGGTGRAWRARPCPPAHRP